MDDEWEPWRSEGIPNVGDYVQIKIGCNSCWKTEFKEGFVASNDPYVKLAPTTITNLCSPFVEKWRRKRPPSSEDDIITEKELEDA